ncbi:MAG: hypothetical protein ABIG44_06135 [Planctomycetota bacterium]
MPLPQTRLPTPKRDGSRFQRIFGLSPGEERIRAEEEFTFDDQMSRMETRTDQRVEQLQREGENLFKQATMSGADSVLKQQDLRRVMRVFTSVRHLDAEAYVPCLLGAHACLEREKVASALNFLTAAAHRQPEAFRDSQTVASYYGDLDEQTGRSHRLDRLMREYVRQTSAGSTLDSALLEAYCALVLGEKSRATAALEKAENLINQGASSSGGLEELLEAIRYALS